MWFGNDDHGPMTGVPGGGMPALAWRGFNEAIGVPPAAGSTVRQPSGSPMRGRRARYVLSGSKFSATPLMQ